MQLTSAHHLSIDALLILVVISPVQLLTTVVSMLVIEWDCFIHSPGMDVMIVGGPMGSEGRTP